MEQKTKVKKCDFQYQLWPCPYLSGDKFNHSSFSYNFIFDGIHLCLTVIHH